MKKRSVIAITALAAMSFQVLATTPFGVTSRDISGEKRLAQQQVFEGFGCHGGNISPQLAWKNPPAGTKSFAVTVYDPDAPTGSGWWHWTVANCPLMTVTQMVKNHLQALCRSVMMSAILVWRRMSTRQGQASPLPDYRLGPGCG